MSDSEALDFSWQPPDPDEMVAVGIHRALSYTGTVRPSVAYLDALAARGIVFTFIQETYSERALEGWQAGVVDAQFANRRADEVGYPADASIAYAVSDRSRFDPSSGGEAIAQYAAGIASVSSRPRFYYGNRYAVDWALAGDPGALGGWLPVTWDFDPSRDLMAQESNTAPPIAGTDLNTVYREYANAGGALPAPPLPEDQQMAQFVWTAPDGSQQLVKLVTGIDGKVRQWGFIVGQGWVATGVVRFTDVDPSSPIEVLPAGAFDSSVQLAMRHRDGLQLIHGYLASDGSWGGSVEGAQDVGPTIPVPGGGSGGSGEPTPPPDTTETRAQLDAAQTHIDAANAAVAAAEAALPS